MVVDALGDLNWLAIAAATAAAFAIGLAWFAPISLGGWWARSVAGYSSIPAKEVSEGASRPRTLGLWLVSIAVDAIALAWVARLVGVESAGDGAVLGLVLGIGLAATIASWPVIFARMPSTWWLLNCGAFVFMQVGMGAILGAWR